MRTWLGRTGTLLQRATRRRLAGHIQNYSQLFKRRCDEHQIDRPERCDVSGVARLTYRLNDYIDKLAPYEGSKMGDIAISSSKISGRALSLAVPKESMTAAQRAAIEPRECAPKRSESISPSQRFRKWSCTPTSTCEKASCMCRPWE